MYREADRGSQPRCRLPITGNHILTNINKTLHNTLNCNFTYEKRKLDRCPDKSDGTVNVEKHFNNLTQLSHRLEELCYPVHIPLSSLGRQTVLYMFDRHCYILQAADTKVLSLFFCQACLEAGYGASKALAWGLHLRA